MHAITSENYPPNIDEIRKHFDLTGDEVFCYGNTIYNPSKKQLTPDIVNHEMIHAQQQSNGKDEWWDLYIKDKTFRASQEIPAHQVQYQTAKKEIKDRERLFRYLHQLAKNLSSEVYGNVLTYSEALKAIKEEKLFDVRKLGDINK